MAYLRPWLRTACSLRPDISKKTVLAMYDEGTPTREFLEKLRDDQWQVVSFDPAKREVCLLVISDRNTQMNLSLTLPELTVNLF